MKNNSYTVVHSADTFLLARLSTDLIMEGVKDDREWNDWILDRLICKWIKITRTDFFTYHSHGCDNNGFVDLRLTLTESNYLDVLTKIIERHGKTN